MSGRIIHFRGGDGPQRGPGKTIRSQDFFAPGARSRGVELAAGLAQVGETIANALVNEKEIEEKIAALSVSNPVKSERLRRAEKVGRIADPMMIIPACGVAGLIAFINPLIGAGVAVGSFIALISASIWADRVQAGEGRPDTDGLEMAKRQLSEARAARNELCAKTGISEKMVGLLQALPLSLGGKLAVLRQAIFMEHPEGHVERVAGILGGAAARGENILEYERDRLGRLVGEIGHADELVFQAGHKASSGEKKHAMALFSDAGRLLEKVLDYANAAKAYASASEASLPDKKGAAMFSARAAECCLKAGDKAGAGAHFDWAAMVVNGIDSDLHSEYMMRSAELA